MSLIPQLRHLLHGSDRTRAVEAEARVLAAESGRQSSLDERLAAHFSGTDPSATPVGSIVGSGALVRLPRERLLGHVGIWGPSGSGKSYLLVTLLRSLLRAGIGGLAVCDPKGETVGLLKRAIVDLAAQLPRADAERLIDRVVVLDPFSTTALPRLQLLAPEAGLDPEIHAYSVARLLTADADMGIGVVQEAVLHRVIECLIRARLPLTVLPGVFAQPEILDALAEEAAPAELFRSTAARLRTESRERLNGLVARVERLLRLRSTRLALGGAPDSVDLGKLLDEKIVLLNLEPPQGSVDIGRFLCGLLWVKWTQAIRRRANGSAPAIVVLEEWPAFLSAGAAQTGDLTEDLLRLARSKGVFLYLLAQDLVSVGKASATLPAVVKTNVHLHAIFRTTDDWSFGLPVTGRRARPTPAPWEARRAIGYLDRGAELALLREGLANLPDRACYLLDRRSGLPALQIRTADLRLEANERAVAALDARATNNEAVLPVAELERGAAGVEARVQALLGRRGDQRASKTAAPAKPGRRPIDIG